MLVQTSTQAGEEVLIFIATNTKDISILRTFARIGQKLIGEVRQNTSGEHLHIVIRKEA